MVSYKKRWERLKTAFKDSGDDEWFALVFARPLANILLLPIVEIEWITPNLLSLLAFFIGLSAVYIIWLQKDILGLFLLLLRCVVDSMDGHLARYRGQGTNLGAYIDKATDAIFWVLLFGVLGYRTFNITGDIIYFWMGFIAAGGRLFIGYVYWVRNYMFLRHSREYKARNYQYLHDPTTLKGWLFSNINIWKFSEPDFYFWIMVFILIKRYDMLMYFLGVTHAILVIIKFFQHGVMIHRLDRR